MGGQTTEILEPQPKLLKQKQIKKVFTIGIIKENLTDERRVPLTPVGVSTLTKLGAQVLIETGAGLGANYTDEDYKANGAQIVDYYQVLKHSNIIIKIAPFSYAQLKQLPSNKIIFSALHPNTQAKENILQLLYKGITAIAYEFYNDQNGLNSFVHLMNEIIGSTSVIIAADLLTNTSGGKGIMLGGLTGITPSEIIVLGTDTAAQYAIRIALGLGATVKVFDDDLSGLLKIKQLFGQHIFTSTFNSKVLLKAFQSADAVINSKARLDQAESFIVTSEMVKSMKRGSVIVDLKIDMGTIIETSQPTTFDKPTYEKYGVVHYCVPNIPSRVARTASVAISNVLTPVLADLCTVGDIVPILRKSIALRNATYIFMGRLTNIQLAHKFNLDAKDINLLLAIF